ncbi:MAG: M1 family aminopeptidase [bacterium]|nr:M1 family aminopeptidase [bacterium]
MRPLFALFIFSCFTFDLKSQVDLESIAKSELAQYYKLKNYSTKRASGENIDIVYAGLNLSPNMKTAYLKGDVNFYFKTSAPVNQLHFDLRTELTVDSIKHGLEKLVFVHAMDDVITIAFNQTISANTLDSVRIYYQGSPLQNNRAYERNVTASGPIIATLSEPYGAHYWWPCRENLVDKIDSLDVRVTVDTAYKVASNGLLQAITLKDSVHTYYWKHRYPVATYLVAFAASRYSVYSDYALLKSNKNLEILNYVFPHNEADARSKTSATIPVIQLFDSLFGTYPFENEKYGHAQFTVGGGMEHQTMSFVGNFGYDLIAHELAHQWFGDKITCGTWHDLWLNESFATYCNLLCYDFLKPREEWYSQLRNFKRDVLTQTYGSVRSQDTVNTGALFEYRTTYQKGAMVLHQLRWLIGDQAFFAGLRNYLQANKHAYGFARSNDLQYYLEQSSGMNLNDYFNDCIVGEGYPIHAIKWNQKGNKVIIDIVQTQSHPSVELYNVPLPILLKGLNKDTLLRIPINKAVETYEITLPYIVNDLIFDPNEWILGKSIISFPKKNDGESITMYPNPGVSDFYAELNNTDATGYTIYDASYKTVLTHQYREKKLKGTILYLDLSVLSNGTYIIQFATPTVTITKRIIIY